MATDDLHIDLLRFAKYPENGAKVTPSPTEFPGSLLSNTLICLQAAGLLVGITSEAWGQVGFLGASLIMSTIMSHSFYTLPNALIDPPPRNFNSQFMNLRNHQKLL